MNEQERNKIVYEAAIEEFHKEACAKGYTCSFLEAKDAIVKVADVGGDIMTGLFLGPTAFAGKKIKEHTGSTGKAALYPALVTAGLGSIIGAIYGGATHGPAGAMAGAGLGAVGGGLSGAASGSLGSLLRQKD